MLDPVAGGSVGAFPGSRALSIAPTDVDQEHNTLRAPLRPIASWELADHHFAFDSSFILPSMTEDLAELVMLVRANPESPLAIFGHADPTGDAGYNKLLSGRRATALFAVLTRRVDLWTQLFQNPMGRDDWKKDDLAGRLMRGVVEPGGTSPALTLFQRYMDAIAVDQDRAAFTVAPASFLGRGADPKGRGDFQGCGEFNPLRVFSIAEATTFRSPANKEARDEANAVNRRVTVFLFSRGTRIDLAAWPCPRAGEGIGRCQKRLWSDAGVRRANAARRREQPADRDTFACRFYDRLNEAVGHHQAIRQLTFRVLDEFGDLVVDTVVFLKVGEATLPAKVGGDGLATFRVPADATEAVLQIGRDQIDVDIAPLPPVTTVAGVQQRLFNLGFLAGAIDGAAGPRTREAIIAFQEEVNEDGVAIPVSGDPADPALQRELVRAHGS